ncbi:MAG: ABC transporter permease [Planctomycetota bacterium]
MLAKREWTRFFRQRNRVSAAVVQPLLFWLLFGAGMSSAFRSESGEDFYAFFLPGTVALIVLFTAIFSTISVIEDRREGFMQSVLVSPVGRGSLLLGKIMGGAAIAWAQAMVFLLLAVVSGQLATTVAWVPLMVLMAVLAIAMCGLGMMVAWPMSSTQGFHAIMMLGLMPMWLLAGTFFPVPEVVGQRVGPTVLGWLMRVNPLSYTMTEMRRLMNPSLDWSDAAFAPSSAVCWIITVVATLAVLAMAARMVRGRYAVDTIV